MDSFQEYFNESGDQTIPYMGNRPQGAVHNDFTPVPRRAPDPRRGAADPDMAQTVRDDFGGAGDPELARLLNGIPRGTNGKYNFSQATPKQLSDVYEYLRAKGKMDKATAIFKMLQYRLKQIR